MKEIFFEEIGYFSATECEKIKKIMDGRTFMDFEVIYSNCAGNCTIGCKTSYDATETEIRNFFLGALIGNMARMIK
jgi:aldehyde:ferredoxin oxidoreductase